MCCMVRRPTARPPFRQAALSCRRQMPADRDDSRWGSRDRTLARRAAIENLDVLRPARSSRRLRPVTAERFKLLQRIPLLQELLEVRLLGRVHALATLPLFLVDQFLDVLLHAVAQNVRVHRIKFPTLVAVASGEPLEPRVLALLACRERRQVEHLLAGERDTLERDVIAAVLLEALRQIDLAHAQAGGVVVADVEDHELAAVA